MRSRSRLQRDRQIVRVCVLAVVCVVGGIGVRAQPSPPSPSSDDPRVGLKAGLRNAGQAARNLVLVRSLRKPDGFFDPTFPAGEPSPPEPDPPETTPAPDASVGSSSSAASSAADATGGVSGGSASSGPTPPATSAKTSPARPWGGLNFVNSDLAFSGHRMFVGNFNGFNAYDIEDPRRVKLLASVVCPGGQGDVSVHGRLLFVSVEQTRGRLDCGTSGVAATVSRERFRGVRIFDISNLRKPRQVAAVQTCRGSHTHTLVVDPNDPAHVYIYGSGTATVRPGEEMEGCSDKDPNDDPNTSLFSIDVIEVPLAAPAQARIVNRPRIFADLASGAIAGLWQGGDHGPGTQKTSVTNQCHDITVFPELGLAAGACSGNGILLDISDPVHPVRLDHATDPNFAYWHSATFNNDATKVIFSDEWGGGTRPRCLATDLANWGADAIFEVVDRKLVFGGYYKMPAPQTDRENCVAHNGSIIPVPGRDIMVQAWYQGGLSVFDFTDPAKPVEIAFFDRGPIDARQLVVGGYWAAYWYNGLIYASEMARGIDVLALAPSDFLSQNEIDAAMLVRVEEHNPQSQRRVVWPAHSSVALAYVDQLSRTSAISAERAGGVRAALARADRLSGSGDEGAAAMAAELGVLSSAIDIDAAEAAGRDAMRLHSLAENLRGRAARLQ